MKYLLLDKKERIAIITINRPDKLNSLTEEVMDEMSTLLDELAADENSKVILIQGAGEKAFVAGGDIGIMQPLNPLQARRTALKAQNLFDKIENFPKPVIALIQGYALGGGCELAMACDIRIAGENAKFGQPEIKLGIIPGFGGTQRLPRLVGLAKAKELIFSGEVISAQEAVEIGLANRVVTQERLEEEAFEFARKLSEMSATALQLSKEALNHGMQMEVHQAYQYEADLFALSFSTQDQKEGMLAFLEKRPPQFKDE